MTPEQQRALAIARAKRARAQSAGQADTPTAAPEQTSQIDDYYSSGIFAGEYNPLGTIARSLDAATTGAQDTATFGFSDELAGMLPGTSIEAQRARKDELAKSNPVSTIAGQVGGGLGIGAMLGPASVTAQATSQATPLIGRVAAGLADGAIGGGLYGFGSGTDMSSRLTEGAIGAGIGGAFGGLFPAAADVVGKGVRNFQNFRQAGRIASEVGTDADSLRMLGGILQADGSLGPQGQANMARAGQDAMLADAGPTARSALDTAIQRGGPGAIVAKDQINARVQRGSQAMTEALDSTMGRPGESLSREIVVYGDKTNPMSLLYKKAYETPIDYSNPTALRIENAVKSRVPPSAIKAANELMRVEGNQSKQILANVAEDGSVVFETLPDVRQLDYITRGLNEVAEQADGQGKLGGTTATGRAYANLSREIRNDLKELVPEYATALDRAGTEIRKIKAEEFGTSLLSPSVTRDQVRDFVQDIPKAERDKLVQGARQHIDDAMARVTRTVQDGDIPARESIKALRDLSSRANREKLAMAIGEKEANTLFSELDRVATSFDLRASVADNSKTYARQAMDQRVKDMTEPGAIAMAAQGKPVNSAQRIAQAITGQTPQKVRAKEDAIYSEIARILTRNGGAGQDIYNAVGRIGQSDQATDLMVNRIAAALSAPRLAYPASTQVQERMRR
jgi:hypothetical protein